MDINERLNDLSISLARIEVTVTSGFQQLKDHAKALSDRIDDIETSGALQVKSIGDLSLKVNTLEGTKKRAAAAAKWLSGIIATVIAALVLAKIGLK